MTVRAPCRISGCPHPWEYRKGVRTVYCAKHLGRLEQNRKRGLRPERALEVMRVELVGLASAVPDTPNISAQDWSAFLQALRDYRTTAIERALTQKARIVLEDLAPLERRILRRDIINATARCPFAEVLDLALACNEEGRWRVEKIPHLAWTLPQEVT